MPASQLRNLSSLFRSASKLRKQRGAGAALKQYASEVNVSPTSDTVRHNLRNPKSLKPGTDSSSDPAALSIDIFFENLKLHSADDYAVDSSKQLFGDVSSVLKNDTVSIEYNSKEGNHFGNLLDIPWCPDNPNNVSLRRKYSSQMRKWKFIYKNTQSNRFNRLIKFCGEKLGPRATFEVFHKLGRVTGPKEFNAMIGLCIDTARNSVDEEVSLQQIVKAYKMFESMKEQGFAITEETYGPLLIYLIDNGLVQQFHLFCELIQEENSHQRLAYYEMLLWINLNDEKKIQELCCNLAIYDGEDKSCFQENYLVAFFERDRRKELLSLLETFDITKVSCAERAIIIFRFLGKLLLKNFAERFLMELKINDGWVYKISSFIYNYVTSMPNLAVEDVILSFKNMHAELELTPTSKEYEKLIQHCCKSSQVRVALNVVEEMLEARITVSLDAIHFLLDACDESREYNLVRRIYSLISHYGLEPNSETFRLMINLLSKMKDFAGAYGMINDLEKLNLMPTAGMYNAIMAGYFREKNIQGALAAVNRMEDACVEPDSQTFSYLLGNCNSEKDINKIFDEMKQSEIPATKNIYMALINAYASCGQFEKAKQVISNKQVPLKSLNEIKSVLVSALASHGEIKDALDLYEEIKQAKCSLEPKAAISLIEYIESEGELDRLLELLGGLHYPDYWMDGCCRVILYCVRHEHLSAAVVLLKQLKDKASSDEIASENIFDEVFCQIAEKESTDMQFGLTLLQAMKEEIGLCPSRRSLDFLLHACINAKDLKACFLIWKEYQEANLPYNVFSYLRMYQALLALGDHKSATSILNKIPKDDPHVRCIISACQETFMKASASSSMVKNRSKKKKKEVKAET